MEKVDGDSIIRDVHRYMILNIVDEVGPVVVMQAGGILLGI